MNNHACTQGSHAPQRQADSDDAYTRTLVERLIDIVRTRGALNATTLDHEIRAFNRTLPKSVPARAKKILLPYYASVRENDQRLWSTWNVDQDLEGDLILTLRMKPSRTSNGIATVTVLTKPWMCGGGCLFCPRDVRMPKSYLHDEPACQRAELNMFDPYLQVTARLSVLEAMGHRTDKVELIVLGGTWDDYPAPYRVWFCKEMFRALNEDASQRDEERRKRIDAYHVAGITEDRKEIERRCAFEQRRVDDANVDFNQAIESLYTTGAWARVSTWQACDADALFNEQDANETAEHRCVGLSVETRPERVSDENLMFMRSLGVTRVQLGIQSLDEHALSVNARHASVQAMARAFALVRSHGLKLHAHFMANLYQSNPRIDKEGYERLVDDPDFMPDEVKLYPCALVKGTGLYRMWERHAWHPYTHAQLIDVLTYDLMKTPAYIRVSRMIRDIPSTDIEVGNKRINLRQDVQRELERNGKRPREMRERSIGLSDVRPDDLHMDVIAYTTKSPDGTPCDERFIQWVTDKNELVGFARLSVPHTERENDDAAPARSSNERHVAYLREVQVFDDVNPLFERFPGSEATKKPSLGTDLFDRLVERACIEAKSLHSSHVSVNCACGMRPRFRKLGFLKVDGEMTRTLS